MKALTLFEIPIYEFKHPNESVVDEVLNEVKNLEYDKNVSNLKSLDNVHYYHNELYKWFEKCLEEVRQKHYVDSIKLEIIATWANKTNKLSKHHRHFHPNSIVSAVFYLTSHDSSFTVFDIDNPWSEQDKHGLYITKPQSDLPFSIKSKVRPEKGKLLIFPSSIWHSTTPLLDNNARYSLSFNTYFSGIIGSGAESTYLEIRPTTAKELSQQHRQ